MRWTVAALLSVGLIAAFCAALLVGGLRAPDPLQQHMGIDKEIPVAVATRDLPAMAPVPADAIVIQQTKRSLAPAKALGDPLQIVGKILALPMTKGQPFTTASFPAQRQGVDLAAMLPNGTRAVSVSLSDYGGLSGLLYPGCRVDVLAAFSMPGNSQDMGKAISTTLLQSIQVLAIEDESVAARKNQTAEEGAASDSDAPRRSTASRSSHLKVTLAVDPKQAAALQLAMEYGSITLAMRNPLDTQEFDQDPTLLSGGQLAKLASFLEARLPNDETSAQDDPQPSADPAQQTPATTASVESATPKPAKKPPQWDMVILRGVRAEQLSFPVDDDEP